MNAANKLALFFALFWFLTAGLVNVSYSDSNSNESLGIYIYENIEGYHTVSSTAGTELSNVFLNLFDKVMTIDRVPLQSNETVRILEEMTEDRKIVVTAINTWLTGGVISTPTITFADDAIKFKDLTWHIDQEKVLADAKEKKVSHALIGSFTGMVKSVKEDKTGPKGRLISVNVIANVRLVEVPGGAVLWAKTYRDIKAGFDFRTAFDSAVLGISEYVAKDAKKSLSQ